MYSEREVLDIVFIKLFKLYFLPAGAMAILPLIITSGVLLWYPLQVLGGICFFAGSSRLVRSMACKVNLIIGSQQ